MTTRLVWWFVSVAVLAGACRRKSPEAPVQPAGATVPEKHPHEDQHEELPRVIKLSPLVLREAKIATAPAEKRKLAATIDLNGQIAPNPDAIAQVSSRVSGRILRVLAKEGDRVRPGQLLLVVVSPELARMRAEYAGTRAKTKAARQNAERLRSLFEQRLGAEQDAATAEAEAAALEAERDEDGRALREGSRQGSRGRPGRSAAEWIPGRRPPGARGTDRSAGRSAVAHADRPAHARQSRRESAAGSFRDRASVAAGAGGR